MDREKEMQSWCYLDNAAMTWPKPLRVRQAVADAMVSGGGNPGRGAHKLSMKASVLVYRAREAVAAMFGASPEQVVFLQNTTYALNTAIKGLLHPGDHVLCSDLEHNAVLRPLEKRMREGQGEYTVFPSFACERGQTPEKICAALEARILPQTRMVVCTHASNICSAQMPLAEIGALCKKRGLLFVVDAAQSAGILPIDMKRMQIDALCMPGHKGLYGPAASGILVLRDGLCPRTLVEGGNGVASMEPTMPDTLPEALESGTLPVGAIAGLCEGIACVRELGIEEIGRHERRLSRAMTERLCGIRGVTVYLPWKSGAVVLFNADGIPCEAVAAALDREGIFVRAGYHCSALGHQTLGTAQTGAVRASFGIFNQMRDVERLTDAVRALVRNG